MEECCLLGKTQAVHYILPASSEEYRIKLTGYATESIIPHEIPSSEIIQDTEYKNEKL